MVLVIAQDLALCISHGIALGNTNRGEIPSGSGAHRYWKRRPMTVMSKAEQIVQSLGPVRNCNRFPRGESSLGQLTPRTHSTPFSSRSFLCRHSSSSSLLRRTLLPLSHTRTPRRLFLFAHPPLPWRRSSGRCVSSSVQVGDTLLT